MAHSRTDRSRLPFPARPSTDEAPPYRAEAQVRSDRLRLWRGVGRVGMTLLVPGSAQLLSREKHIGRWAIRIWAAVILSVLAWFLLLFVNRGAAVAIISFKPLTVLMAAVLALGGIGWAGLLLHAWKLSNPISLAPKHRLGFGAASLALALGISGTGLASASVMNAQGDFIGSVFAGGGDTAVKDGRYNVLLLGGDADQGRQGLRPDSLTVASVDARTGHTVLFSLPRNLEDFSFPSYSPMRKLYPDKFTCSEHACMLNAVYTAATENAGLYPGVRDPGAVATVEAVEWITGLDINYYVLVDLDGFKELIDAVGGIKVDVMKPVPVGGGSTAVGRYIEPGTAVHLNGQDALWFARSRHDSNDYERMARQKCVMHAMLNQLDPFTVATKFTGIASAGKEVMSSNVPAGEMDRLIDLALKARSTKIASVSFVPPLIYPGAPDFGVARTIVAERIDAAEEAAKQPAAPATTEAPAPPPTTQAPSPSAAATSGRSATRTPSATRLASPTPAPARPRAAKVNPADTDDLGIVCRAA
ncbi:MAG: LCP family protein [Propionibacteriaceae bacterium]|nr:LCP family protein [Propionibacteriaceae bacterium]